MSLVGTTLDIPLNAAGVAALNAASGSIAIGTAVTSISGTNPQWIFGDSAGYNAGLSLVVPEPAAGTFLLSGLVALRARKRRP